MSGQSKIPPYMPCIQNLLFEFGMRTTSRSTAPSVSFDKCAILARWLCNRCASTKAGWRLFVKRSSRASKEKALDGLPLHLDCNQYGLNIILSSSYPETRRTTKLLIFKEQSSLGKWLSSSSSSSSSTFFSHRVLSLGIPNLDAPSSGRENSKSSLQVSSSQQRPPSSPSLSLY